MVFAGGGGGGGEDDDIIGEGVCIGVAYIYIYINACFVLGIN